MTVPSADPRAAQRATLRRAVLQLVIGVVVLDAVAMGTYYLAGISHAAPRTRMIFVAVWTVATIYADLGALTGPTPTATAAAADLVERLGQL